MVPHHSASSGPDGQRPEPQQIIHRRVRRPGYQIRRRCTSAYTPASRIGRAVPGSGSAAWTANVRAAVGIRASARSGRLDVFGGSVQAAVADRGAFHDGVDGKTWSRHLHDGQPHAQLGPIRAVKRISSVERDARSGQICRRSLWPAARGGPGEFVRDVLCPGKRPSCFPSPWKRRAQFVG